MRIRLKQILDALKMSQEEFGQSVGYAQSTVGCWVSGSLEIRDRHIKAICRAHNVNEHWFRTGEGEMFAPAKADETDVETYRRVLKARIHALPPEVQDLIWEYAGEIRDACHPRPGQHQQTDEGGENNASARVETRRVA